MVRKSGVASTLAALASTVAVAEAAGPTTYVNNRNPEPHTRFVLAANGRSFNSFFIGSVPHRCTGRLAFGSAGERRVRVGSRGGFSFSSPKERGQYPVEGRARDHGSYRFHMSGRVTHGRVTGTFTYAFVGKRIRCQIGPRRFVARRTG